MSSVYQIEHVTASIWNQYKNYCTFFISIPHNIIIASIFHHLISNHFMLMQSITSTFPYCGWSEIGYGSSWIYIVCMPICWFNIQTILLRVVQWKCLWIHDEQVATERFHPTTTFQCKHAMYNNETGLLGGATGEESVYKYAIITWDPGLLAHQV